MNTGYERVLLELQERLDFVKAQIQGQSTEIFTLRHLNEYYEWRLNEIIPLFQEARDALTVITTMQRDRRGISPSLATRMDEAGTRNKAQFNALKVADALQRNFIYAESEDGGMMVWSFTSTDMSNLTQMLGWMTSNCKEEDEAVLEWMKTAVPGDQLGHRMGHIFCVRTTEWRNTWDPVSREGG